MSHNSYNDLYDEVADILPSLTPAQAEELTQLLEDNDTDSARFYLSFLAKNYRDKKADEAVEHFHSYDLLT